MAYQILRLSRSAMQEQINSATAAGFPHYVYGLLRGDTGELFYVGKGTGDRVFKHTKPSVAKVNPHKARVIDKHGIAGFAAFGFFADDALAYAAEVEVIAACEARLTNLTAGGEGFTSEELRARYEDPVFAAKMREIYSSPERSAQMSAGAKRQMADPEHKRKMREAASAWNKARWQDAEYRERKIAQLRSEENKERQRAQVFAHGVSELSALGSAAISEKWQDDVWREKMTEQARGIAARNWQDPVIGAKLAANLAKIQQSPKKIRNQKEFMRLKKLASNHFGIRYHTTSKADVERYKAEIAA